MSLDQKFTVLEHSIRTLNSSHHRIPSLKSFRWIFSDLSLQTHHYPAEQAQEVIWQRAILFRNLLSEEQWMDSAEIPMEVWNVFKNLEIFTDEDLGSIFNVLRIWVDRHPQDAELPSQCWAVLTFGLELDQALWHRTPVRNFWLS
ncbi:hypothetical protein BD779DRAFT_1476217 [Infundibulicybe gibba]|nr:hypothetical protein BD779DRAFT_1476217 [Infundibulicybe gibba]